MTIQNYLTNLNKQFVTGNAREHSYRGDLQTLLSTILPDVLVTNEPARVACGAPDYVLTRKEIPVGYIEAKDVGVDLGSKTLKEQFDRYKSGLSNLIFTDYLEFHFYKEGQLTTKIKIGKVENGQITGLPENFDSFTQLIKNFAETITQTIKSPTKLAEMMAGKARLMADVIEKSLDNDDEKKIQSNLKAQMLSFQDMLIHDIDNKAFSDIYAQTIAYGMFAARYHDPTLPTFSREEAATLIPKSNPFLRKLFQDIAGYDLDDRLVWIVDELVRIFLATDVAEIMKNFGRSTKQEDPVVHFYETFLASYSPALRKARGVWYTPQPVVNFIVRAVDDILKTEFNLKDGLADTSKIKIKKKAVTKATADKRSKLKEVEEEVEVHKVQILDPATGTGTFLAEVVRHIHKKFEGQQGIWSKYVTNDLIPRLNGFELLMASYAMAHLKMDMLLTETGYKPTDEQRFRIFLTNSLEEHHKDTGTLFSHWLADEANQANAIKRDAPVMVVIGNPPYSGESANKGEWIMNLMEDYKKEPGGKEKLKEKNSKWINDDYVKFIRFGQHFIDKNGEGILAFINPHGFLDNPTFRGMRWNLLQSFDKIYTIDLHGNNKKKETAPDGSIDQNVFDIMQGVSINLFIKTGKKEKDELGQIFHYDLYGKREYKYDYLTKNTIKSIAYTNLISNAPMYFMVNKDLTIEEHYNKGIEIQKLFLINGNGIVSKRDSIAYSGNLEEIKLVIEKFYTLSLADLRNEFEEVSWESRDGKIEFVKENVVEFGLSEQFYEKCLYRPFDKKWTYYTGKSKGFIGWPVKQIMSNFIHPNNNLGLVIGRQGQVVGSMPWNLIFISDSMTDFNLYYRGGGMLFPLYLYPDKTNQLSTEGKQERVPNFNMEIVNQISKGLGLEFVPEREGEGEVCFANSSELRDEFKQCFAPIDLLDYIYAVLHSPAYREKYKEFLKIDFPRVPYPANPDEFWKLVKLGGEIRQIHLLESQVVGQYITQYPVDGDNVVEKPRFEEHTPNPSQEGNQAGRVCINETQYFDNVTQVAWNFYIGGYQPAQKWLKDRKGRELSYEDIFHYQKIIVALTETNRLMKEIDTILVV